MSDSRNLISEMISHYIQESFLNEQIMSEAYDLLYEKLVVFGGGAKYGQIVFMSGGAGSGKGFASKAFMEAEKFKIRDVDEWKVGYLKLAKLKDINPELKALDLRKSADVFALHTFVKKRGIKDRTLELLLGDVKADRLPNIIFDITGKEMADFQEVIPHLEAVGYEAKNINVAWVLTDFKVSYIANLTRSRVVTADVFLGTHQGAAKTMQSLIDQKKMPKGADGRFVVIMNNRENTIFFNTGDTVKGRKVDLKNQKKVDAPGVAGFYYITVKDAGKPFRSEETWKEELHAQIVRNVPGGQDNIDRLRKHAIDTMTSRINDPDAKEKDHADAKSALELVRRDAALDRINRQLEKRKKPELKSTKK
jgi:hypothetical protein